MSQRTNDQEERLGRLEDLLAIHADNRTTTRVMRAKLDAAPQDWLYWTLMDEIDRLEKFSRKAQETTNQIIADLKAQKLI